MTTPIALPRGRTAVILGAIAFVVLNLIITKLRGHPSNVPAVTLAPNTGVPPVPTNADFPYDRTNNVVAIVGLGIVGLIGLGLAVREYVRNHTLLPLFLTLGTVVVVVPEVFVDVIGMVYYPTDATDHAFDLFGRQMGWFILAGWFGAGAYGVAMLKILQTRPTAKQVWLVLLGTGLSYTIFEELLVTSGGIYHYYGNQPMWWHSLPLWWTPCNVIGCAFLPAAFAYRFSPMLRGWRASVMLIVVPACVAGAYAFIAMPSWIVVNGDYPWLVTQLAGLATWALGIGMIAVIMNVFLGYRPFDPTSRPTELAGSGDEVVAAPRDAQVPGVPVVAGG